jgi:tetratricopeptide (TPR) repeat protein
VSRESLQRPIEELADSLRRFMRVEQLRLMCVEAQGRLRQPAVQTVLGFEHHCDNLSPLIPLTFSAASDTDSVWGEACEKLRDKFEELREAGSPLAELPEPETSKRYGSATFSVQLLQCVHAVQAPAKGLLLVLLVPPGKIQRLWLDRIRDFSTSKELGEVRFIAVLPPSPEIEPWLESFPKATAVHHQCDMDATVVVEELTAEIDAEEELGAGFRGAWPRGVKPPPNPRPGVVRPSEPPPGKPAEPSVRRAAVSGPVGADEEQERPKPPPTVRVLAQRASVAMLAGDGPEAIRQQAAARDLCLEQGEVREAIHMEMMLGAYMTQLEQPDLATDVFEKAARRAYDAKDFDLAAEAFLAQGAVHDAQSQAKEAVRAYRYAIDNGTEADRPALVLQAYWLAGQTALRSGLELDALALWADAVAYAREQPPQALRQTKAKPIAEELCELLSKHRRYSEARMVERTAAGFSTTTVEEGPSGTG